MDACDSKILTNYKYSTLILRLFKNSKVKLSKIHSQYNIEPQKFLTLLFY